MGNKGANQSNAMLGSQLDRVNTNNTNLLNTMNAGLTGAQGRSDRAFENAFAGYSDIGAHGLGGGGGAPQAGTLGGGTGLLANVNPLSSSRWGNFIKTGGVTPEEREAAMGWGLFKNWAQSPTGGLSDQEVQDIYGEGVAPISGFYGALRENLERQNAAQGGYNPGFTAQMSELARQQSNQGAAAARGTRLGLLDQIGQRQQFGAGTGSERQLQLSDLVNKYKAMGMHAADAVDRANAAMQAQANAQAASMGLASSQANTQARLAGLGGLTNLRGQAPGEVGQYLQGLLSANDMAGTQGNPLLGLRVQNNPRTNWAQVGGQLLGGIAGGVLTGGMGPLLGGAAKGLSGLAGIGGSNAADYHNLSGYGGNTAAGYH